MLSSPAVASTDGEQLEIVFQPFDRRHEHANPPVARLDGERGADRNAGSGRRRDDARGRALGAAKFDHLGARDGVLAAMRQ